MLSGPSVPSATSAWRSRRRVERERSEAALKAALLRSEAAEAQVRRGRHLLDTVATMARIGGWELDLATMMPIWSDEAYRIAELDPSKPPTFMDTLSFYPRRSAPAWSKSAVGEALRSMARHTTSPCPSSPRRASACGCA